MLPARITQSARMGKAAALPYLSNMVGRRCRAAQISIPHSIPRPLNFMDAPEKRPILWSLYQSSTNGVFTDVLPLLRITFPVTQTMVKSPRLKYPGVRVHLCEAVFPKAHPSLNGEFQIMRRAEEMKMIRHEEIIAHQPCRCRPIPDIVQRPLDRSLRQPTFAFLRAYRKKNPICTLRRNVNPFRWGTAAGFQESPLIHNGYIPRDSSRGKI